MRQAFAGMLWSKLARPDLSLVEIVGFWTPEYLGAKLQRLREARIANLLPCIDEARNVGPGDLPEAARRDALTVAPPAGQLGFRPAWSLDAIFDGGRATLGAMAEPPDRVTDPTLAELLRRLVPAYRPERVYLFGSRARGEAR